MWEECFQFDSAKHHEIFHASTSEISTGIARPQLVNDSMLFSRLLFCLRLLRLSKIVIIWSGECQTSSLKSQHQSKNKTRHNKLWTSCNTAGFSPLTTFSCHLETVLCIWKPRCSHHLPRSSHIAHQVRWMSKNLLRNICGIFIFPSLAGRLTLFILDSSTSCKLFFLEVQ
jgi:hypothetical protein